MYHRNEKCFELPNNKYKKSGWKNFQNFFHISVKYCHNSFSGFVEKWRTIILNIANIQILLARTKICCAKQQNHSG